MGTAWNGRYYNLIKQGAPIAIEWNQGAIKESAFAIPKGAKDAYWGQRMLATMADPKLQGAYADIIGYPGLNLDATQYTDPKMVPNLPTQPGAPAEAVLGRSRMVGRQRSGNPGALGALDACRSDRAR